MGNKGDVSVCDDIVKLVDCISECKNVSVEKKVFEFSENNFRFANDEEKNVEMEDMFFRGKREHKCRLCNKVFGTYQALGGHQRVHKSTSTTSVVNIEDYENKIPINKFSEMEYSCKLAKPECNDNPAEENKTEKVIENKGHKCSICLKMFATGQALGGHKKVHFGKDTETGAEESRVLKHQFIRHLRCI
ncbi:hypothetical protein C1H46_028359 [Malus baccata]|uniref:C2H2-type domain-containing protein n=1 Tax=Malus baccata TaxID=106549 RepID=A0A540LHY5_MALBA|nr:hypothetical protein C1H46_028359 [Malus baccata]